ncbi:hypothetical protein ES703_63343 [subsurface metagenome]
MDAHCLPQGNGHQSVGIIVAKVQLAGKWQLRQVSQGLDIIRGDPFFLESSAVEGHSVIYLSDFNLQPLELKLL